MVRAAVLGATGYLGGELLRWIVGHPELELAAAVSHSHAGERVHDLFPNLAHAPDLTFSSSSDRVDVDIALLAQPPGEAMKEVPDLLERGIRIVDLGPDYRLPDPAEYARVYGRPHADPTHLEEAVYGLTELHRDKIRRSRLVANPGCYPTATLLALAPLLSDGGLEGPIVVDAKSGTSGAGAAPTPTSHHPEAAGTVWPYGTPEHRHLPEMRAVLAGILGDAPPIVFVPHLVPLVRGILCSIYVPSGGAADAERWNAQLQRTYAGAPFVSVGGIPKLPWAAGTNRCFLSVQSSAGTPVIFSALDNLGKGGAAQAVQNANLMLGLPETTGLLRSGFGV